MPNVDRLYRLAERIDRRWGWHRLPAPLGLLTLMGLRAAMRSDNLHDPYPGEVDAPPAPRRKPAEYLTVRTVDGSYNDLCAPSMGMAGTRFGRNLAPESARAELPPRLFDPNPRTVSTQLLRRTRFMPARTLNVLAAAWLQFQVHDWFCHGTNTARMIELPRPGGDDWHEDPIRIPSTPDDPTASPGQTGSTFVNQDSHWWDGSQIYGSTTDFHERVRTGHDGKVSIDSDGFIAESAAGCFDSHDGWWLGLELMSTLFLREHNAICDRLKSAYPQWSDDLLFEKARLVNAALIAKIHTVEWTPAILDQPTVRFGMRGNWFGAAGERVARLAGRLGPGDFLSGIPGSLTDHYGAPFSITEEFIEVYRMHPLMPDDYDFVAVDHTQRRSCGFDDIRRANSRTMLENVGFTNALFSLGIAHPGAVRLHNSPRFMERLHVADATAGTGQLAIDLNAVDVLRTRERGVPRYNEFRRQLRLPPARTFEQLSDEPDTAALMSHIYDGDIEKVDLTVGLFGEPTPSGFGFSDTAFRIFLLMASQRLKSDRFYTVDFTPRVYTPEGMAWIADNDMVSVLVRHYPELSSVLARQRNAFAPWTGRR